MNILNGKIISIKVSGNLSLVTIDVNDILLKAIVIETPQTASYLQTGNLINVIFKETEVVIGKGTEHWLSLQNKLPATIREIENGALLCRLTLDSKAGKIVAIVTLDAVLQLQLKAGESITAMIKTNEIMLSV
jgi:molybdate transport system regulatory protein